MCLFNLMFIRNLLNSNLIVKSSSHFITTSINSNFFKESNSYDYDDNSNILYIMSRNDNNFDIPINNLANKKFVSRNFITKLLNQYWQETIFLSPRSLVLENYSNQLKSDGISVYKNRYKKFLFDFSKALITGRIEATLQNSKKINSISNDIKETKYIWRKGLNFSLPKNFSNFLSLKKQSNFPNSYQIELIKKMQQNKLPIFTVVNNFSQIVVAEPSDELISKRGPIDTIYQFYYDRFLWDKDHKHMYEGLFFVNSEDAKEYKEHIANKYIYSSKYTNLNIFAASLDFYYKLVRISPSRVQFHLIPDLKELGNLIYKYQNKRNLVFHNQQKRGRYFFQGQPIYIIQPMLAKNKQTQQTDLVNYIYELKQNEIKQEYEAIFMNYEIALLAWQRFVQQNHNYSLPNHPNILVYNLEDFLKFHESNKNIYNKNLLFVPSQQSYKFIKTYKLKKSQYHIHQTFLSQFIRFQIIIKRIIWSLTSRQPTSL